MNAQQTTFYWHDYETWGLSPALDRPSQFAGIRTDMDFNIIAEPDMFYCRLTDDYLPQPEAAIITHITPETTQSEGVAEFEFARRINQQFSQTNTCVVGYNSIRFDDEFSRNLFYRNFYDPYEYCWKNNNSRWDIIDLVRATYALRPDGINWPKNEQGLPSFRLELLTEANGIAHDNAHDATSDVYATIAIAKLIKQKCPKLFDYYFELRDKNKVKDLIDVDNKTAIVHISGMFGSVRANIGIVAPIVWHPENKNAVVVVDLAQDISPLLELSSNEMRERLYTKRDELGDKLAIPLKLIHINKCPFIAVEKTLLPENIERLAIDRELCLSNLHILKNNPQLAGVLSDVFLSEKQFDNKGNVDAMIYDGFFSFNDKRHFETIRKSTPQELATLQLPVKDKRFKDLFLNYRARNFPETLTEKEKQRWAEKCSLFFSSISADYFSNLESFSEQYKGDEECRKIIESLKTYADSIVSR